MISILILRAKIIWRGAEAHLGRHFVSVCYVCWSRKVEGGVRFSWAQCKARVGEIVFNPWEADCISNVEMYVDIRLQSFCGGGIRIVDLRLFLRVLKLAGRFLQRYRAHAKSIYG
jgi:hypothetical protein